MHFKRVSNNDVLIILYNQEGWKTKFAALTSRQEMGSKGDDFYYLLCIATMKMLDMNNMTQSLSSMVKYCIP